MSVWNIHAIHYCVQAKYTSTELNVVSAACLQVKLVVAGVRGQESAHVVRQALCVCVICSGVNPPSGSAGGSCGRCVFLIPLGWLWLPEALMQIPS